MVTKKEALKIKLGQIVTYMIYVYDRGVRMPAYQRTGIVVALPCLETRKSPGGFFMTVLEQQDKGRVLWKRISVGTNNLVSVGPIVAVPPAKNT